MAGRQKRPALDRPLLSPDQDDHQGSLAERDQRNHILTPRAGRLKV